MGRHFIFLTLTSLSSSSSSSSHARAPARTRLGNWGGRPAIKGQLNASLLAAVVNATRLRIQVARELMPNAGIGLYATVRGFEGCTSAGPMEGFHRAAALGVFDDITHLVPVLYMGSKTNVPAATTAALEASLTLRPRDNRTLPMVILLSWVLVDGRREGCAFEYVPKIKVALVHVHVRTCLMTKMYLDVFEGALF